MTTITTTQQPEVPYYFISKDLNNNKVNLMRNPYNPEVIHTFPNDIDGLCKALEALEGMSKNALSKVA